MPPRLKILILGTLLAAHPALAYQPLSQAAPRPFNYHTDTFAFANETVFNYVGGTVKAEAAGTKKREYTRRCFVVTRAAVQFWKFARFEPAAPALSDDQLAARIRAVTGRDVWQPFLPAAQRVIFPGYTDLREISAAHPGVFQANIGLGWPIYVRPGNAPIAVPATLGTEERLNSEIFADLKKNQPTIVWLYLFPSLKINHVVVVYAGNRVHGDYRYQVYDPNYADGSKTLEFHPATRRFTYQPTFYFKGGTVTARAIYRGLLQ